MSSTSCSSGGISKEGDLLDLAIKDEIVKKSGAWFSYGDVRLGQGRENVKTFLKDNPDLFEEIKAAVVDQTLGHRRCRGGTQGKP